jgi:hypothetical protein
LAPPGLFYKTGISILGANVSPGHREDQNPYRSEIGGIFAVVVVVEALVKFHDISQGTIELACDCESGLILIFTHEYDTPSQPHHDRPQAQLSGNTAMYAVIKISISRFKC